MLLSLLLLPLFLLPQEEVPYKPAEEIKVELDYKFKQRPSVDNLTVDYGETREQHERRKVSGPLPYLMVNFTVLSLKEGEVRIRGINNLGNSVITKKAEVGTTFKIDLGYTDDMKDRVSPYEFNIYFLSPEKKNLSRVHLLVLEDGTFLINGEKRGKF